MCEPLNHITHPLLILSHVIADSQSVGLSVKSILLLITQQHYKKYFLSSAPWLHPFVLLLQVACSWRCVWGTGGLILTDRNNSSTQRKTYLSATSSMTNIKWTVQASYQDLRDERPSFDISSLSLQFTPNSENFFPLWDHSVNAV
jgi:hypothetical protein